VSIERGGIYEFEKIRDNNKMSDAFVKKETLHAFG
jgi:hypothetical protein